MRHTRRRRPRARELGRITSLLKERRFTAGETVIKEGSAGAAFYVIESGEARVTIRGEPRAALKEGDFFGEIALIDAGARMATITATTDLVCQGLTLWKFRPLVEENGPLGWTLMQTLTRELRSAEQPFATATSTSPPGSGTAAVRLTGQPRVGPARPPTAEDVQHPRVGSAPKVRSTLLPG